MNIYHTETEQIEIIRQWFKKYGHWISSLVIVVLLVVLGYRFWENHQLKIETQASERYQQLMQAVADDDDTLIQTETNDLITHFPQTVYAQTAALIQAKQAVAEQKWPEALSHLQYVITHASSPALQETARLRSARILIMQKKYSDALSLLNIVDDSAYRPAINEIKGDIYVQLNDNKQAIVYYQKALKGFSKAGLNSPTLTMKLNEIQ